MMRIDFKNYNGFGMNFSVYKVNNI